MCQVSLFKQKLKTASKAYRRKNPDFEVSYIHVYVNRQVRNSPVCIRGLSSDCQPFNLSACLRLA